MKMKTNLFKKLLIGTLFSINILFAYQNINMNTNLNDISKIQKMLTPETQKQLYTIFQNLSPEDKIRTIIIGVEAFNQYLSKNIKYFKKYPFYIKKVTLEHNPSGYFLNFIVIIRDKRYIQPLSKMDLSDIKKSKINMGQNLMFFAKTMGVGVEYSFYYVNNVFLFKKVIVYPR